MNLTNLHELAKTRILTRRDMGDDADQAGSARNFAYLEARRLGVQIPSWNPRGPVLLAYVNAGRWLVDCPDCGGDEYGAPDDAAFWCASCANVLNESWPRPVAWPQARGRIEALLLQRPAPILPGAASPRNWLPHEPVEQLAAENRNRGLAEQ